MTKINGSGTSKQAEGAVARMMLHSDGCELDFSRHTFRNTEGCKNNTKKHGWHVMGAET